MISRETILSRNTSMLANEIGHETVMMSIEQGKYYGTNKTGSYIWKLLDNPLTFGELCSKLALDFNIPETQCLQEVQPFMEEMIKENIIVIK